ncbi:uncharacterized protein LOC112463704 isoform X2 [Temnothorax curvispinosus]|uniref:Uncharacterized protein LOC112463704 isoform X2 n=1 Tax=Temnothorax curvispinosus TaxID=300111 RepID=A0A6J1QTX1_9HYME|nr:uncharacterized protein LOC112463704 isoform X2 [Temnothorax curvispinosus]
MEKNDIFVMAEDNMADSEQNREDGDGSQKPKGQVTTAAIMENFEAQASDEIHEHGQNSALQDMLNRTIQMQQEAKTEFGKLLKAKQVETTSEKAVKRIDQSKPRITSIVNMPAVNSSTPEFRNSVVSEDMIRNIFRKELNKLNLDTNIPKNCAQEKEQTTQANNSNMADQIKEAI